MDAQEITLQGATGWPPLSQEDLAVLEDWHPHKDLPCAVNAAQPRLASI
jgi:hypothetical protein